VCLTGEAKGVWKDFAEEDHCGDILKLWMLVRRVSFATALAEAEEWLRHRPKADGTYVEPEIPEFELLSRLNKPEFWDPCLESFWHSGSKYLRNDPGLQFALDQW
jgi:hypothetical protein